MSHITPEFERMPVATKGGEPSHAKIVICDSHPVQYKAPVYQELERMCPGQFEVLYYTDRSVRGCLDAGFGTAVTWDIPLMSGYKFTLLNQDRDVPLPNFRALHGFGIYNYLYMRKPRAVILSQLLYEADIAVWLGCKRLRIPLWFRMETQDEAYRRPIWKSALRAAIYRAIYFRIAGTLAIGKKNRDHYLRHGIASEKVRSAPYCVSSIASQLSFAQKQEIRDDCRASLSIEADKKLVLFSGKLIPKKNPGLLIEAIKKLSASEQQLYVVVFVGSGELEGELHKQAAMSGIAVRFTGFVNQSRIQSLYFAADILVLPSRRMGETWGLVVNEALHAGCAVIISEAAGCSSEFGAWERVRVIPERNNAGACAAALCELGKFARSFDWCKDEIAQFSVKAAASGFATLLDGNTQSR